MEPGHGPQPTAASTATPLATQNADQCVHPPREGGGRNRQTPLTKKNGEGRGPPPNHERAPTRKKKGGARDSHTTAKLHTHSTRGRQPRQPGNTKGDTRGAPQKNNRGPRCPTRRHPEKSSGLPQAHDRRGAGGKDTPDTPAHVPPEKWRATGKKKKGTDATKMKGEGGTETKGPKTGTGGGEHHRAKTRPRTTHTHPAARKGKEGGGGNPAHGNPRTTPRHRQPRQGVAGKGRGPRTGAHTPTAQPEKQGAEKNPNPHTHTTNPSEEWRSAAKTRIEAHTP